MIQMILTLLGALGMFLLGMNMLSGGLQKAAGAGLRRFVASITSSPLKGVLTGLGDSGESISRLLENSVKYAGEGTTVTIEGTPAQGPIYRDNGRGVPPDELPHIFDRFWRSDYVRGGKEGSGLGLSIVRNAVHLHAATIRAYTPEPHGLGFVIEGLGKNS